MPEQLPNGDDDLRVGDAERRAVDERLHRAVGDGLLTLSEYEERAGDVWGARTRGELAAVVRDLPGAPRPAFVAVPVGGGRRRSVAVMGEERLAGPVAPGEAVEGYAVMGKTTLDLRRDDLPADVRVRAVAVMGEVEVLVPDGAAVHLSGAALMAQRSVQLAPAVAGGPQVHLTARAVMGSVTVRSGAGAPVAAQPVPWGPYPAVAQVAVRHPARRLPRHKKLMLAGIAVVALGGLGVFGDSGREHRRPRFGDETLSVPAGATEFAVPGGVGDVTVIVPDGVRAFVDDGEGVGDLTCALACTGASRQEVRIVVRHRVGDVEIQSATEHGG